MHRGITGEPVKTEILIQEVWVGLRFSISNKPTGDVYDVCPWTVL